MALYAEVVKRVVEGCESVGIDYVIVGGFVAILHGRMRTTTDVDLIVEEDRDKYEQFLKSLEEKGFDVMWEQGRQAFEDGTNFSIFDNRSVLRIDLKVARRTLEVSALEEAVTEEFEGMQIRRSSLESLLLGKLIYMGDLSDIPRHDLFEFTDVMDFIVVYNENTDIDKEQLVQRARNRGLETRLELLLNLAAEYKRS